MKLTSQEWAEIDRIKDNISQDLPPRTAVQISLLISCLEKLRGDGFDWSAVPDWVQFKVQDKFGKTYLCETPPIKDKKNHTWYVNSGRMIEASRQPNPLWERSLEVRPLEKKQTRNRR